MLGAYSLIVAGLAFGAFFGSRLLGPDAFDLPRETDLALHGLWMITLAIGVPKLVRPMRGWASAAGWVAAASTIIGMLTGFPLFAVGLILLATTQWSQPTRRPAAGALGAGALLLLGSLPLEGRFDGAGSPAAGTPAAFLFSPAVLLVALGLIGLGRQLRHGERKAAVVATAP